MAGSRDSIEAGRGHVTLSVNKTGLEQGLDAAERRFKSYGLSVAATGAIITAAAAAITAPYLQGLNVFSEFGRESVQAIRRTGVEFETLHRIMDGTRTSADEIAPALVHMNQQIAASSPHLHNLGIDLHEIGSLDTAARFDRIADAISRMGQDAPRLQREIFGRTFRNAILEGGAPGIQARAARTQEIRGVQTPADVALARSYNEAMREMKIAIEGFWLALSKAAAPAMIEFFRLATDVIVTVRKWTDENRYWLDVAFRVADKIVALGFIVGGLGTAIYAASYAIAFFKVALLAKVLALVIAQGATIAYTVVTAAAAVVVGLLTGEIEVLTVTLLAFAAIAGVVGTLLLFAPAVAAAALIYTYWDEIANLFSSTLLPDIRRFGATLMQAFGAIADAIYAGNWLLALQIVWATIKVFWQRGVNFVKQAWDDGMYLMAMYMVDIAEKIEQVFLRMVNNIIAAINRIIDSVPESMRFGLTNISGVTGSNWQAIRNTMTADLLRANEARREEANLTERELENLQREAEMQAFLADNERRMAEPPAVGGGNVAETRTMVAGGFAAGDIFGLQQARHVDVAQRQRQQQIARLDQMIVQLNEVIARVAPVFG